MQRLGGTRCPQSGSPAASEHSHADGRLEEVATLYQTPPFNISASAWKPLSDTSSATQK